MIAQFFRIIALYLIRIILRIFWVFPIDKNKIVFCSYGGKQYACNPKYIFEYMIEHYGNAFKYIWAVNTVGIMPEKYKNIKTVKYMSFGYIYHVLTSRIIIYNNVIQSFFPIRRNQIVVNTWHGGGAYKRMHIDAFPDKRKVFSMKATRRVSSKAVKYVISSCEKFTTVGSNVWTIPAENFLPIGMPRNDIFFNISSSVIKNVKDHFNLNDKKKIVLYAPTFWGNLIYSETMFYSLNVQYLLQTLNSKFGNDFVLLYRLHMSRKNNINVQYKDIIPASDYPDMQELLCATDVLITDYSSSIWDFSFTFKPCFLFTPDLEEYVKKQGFYTPIEEWPFPFAKTSEQLIANIEIFDREEYTMAVKNHHKALGSYEQGTATKKLFDILFTDG